MIISFFMSSPFCEIVPLGPMWECIPGREAMLVVHPEARRPETSRRAALRRERWAGGWKGETTDANPLSATIQPHVNSVLASHQYSEPCSRKPRENLGCRLLLQGPRFAIRVILRNEIRSLSFVGRADA